MTDFQNDPWLDLRRLRANVPSDVEDTLAEELQSAIAHAESYHRAARHAGPETSAVALYYCLVQLGKAVAIVGGHPVSGGHGLTAVAPVGEPDGDELQHNPVDDSEGESSQALDLVDEAKGEALRELIPEDESSQVVGRLELDPEAEDEIADCRKPSLLEWIVKDSRGAKAHDRAQRSHFATLQLAVACAPIDGFEAALGSLIDGNPDLHDLFRNRPSRRPIIVAPVDFDSHLPFDKRLPRPDYPTSIRTARKVTDAAKLGVLTAYPISRNGSASLSLTTVAPIANDGWYEDGFYVNWVKRDEAGERAGPEMIRGWTTPGLYDHSYIDEFVVAPRSPCGDLWSRINWWWPLLYALGHIARYEPVAWSRAINLDEDEHAADMRAVLDRAWQLVPSMGLWAIREARRARKPVRAPFDSASTLVIDEA